MIPIDEVVIFDVATHVASTGAISDADSAPTFDVFEEDTDTPILSAQTMTKRTSKTGNYRGSVTCSAANGFEAGKWYSVVVSATVSSVSAKCVAKQFRVAPAESQAGVPKTDTAFFGGTAGTFASGRPEVNASHWAGTATTLTSSLPDVNTKTIAAGIIAAATFAANALDAVWSTATRLLTAGTNIVLAKGTGVTGFNDLSAAQVNTEADTALSDVGLTGTVTGRIDAAISSRLASGTVSSDVTAIKAKTDNLPSDPADASDIAAATSLIASGVAAVKAKTDNLPTDTAAVLATLSTYDGSDTSGVTTLLTRLSDVRAALLDNLANLDAAISAITLTTSERNAIADAYLDRANGIETGLTPREADRLMLAALLGKASGMDSNAPVFRDFGDTKDRISATTDEFGNRLDVTVDVS